MQYAYNSTPGRYLPYGVPFTLKRMAMVPVTPRGISNFNGHVTFLADRAHLKVWVPLYDSSNPTSRPTQGGTRCILSLSDSPVSEFYVSTLRNALFHIHGRCKITPPMKMEQTGVPKRRHTKFRRQEITPKNTTLRTRQKF
jgi:hypothetical protein